MMNNGYVTFPQKLWNMDFLCKCPKVFDAGGFESDGVKALYFNGLDFQGKPTRVFAWIGFPKHCENEKVPGVVLVHGGGGTAYAEWVRIWNRRGYAAIAVSTTGKDGIETEIPEQSKLQPHQWAGPTEEDKFRNIENTFQDHWAYHAVADIVLAHSLLASYPQVDSDHIGITGVSWGGFLTGIVTSIDNRFKCAALAYGCGFINVDSITFVCDKDSEEGKRWIDLWDPSNYLCGNNAPLFWFTGTNDPAYSLDIFEKSYTLIKGSLTLRIGINMFHSHVDAWAIEEQYIFFDSCLKAREDLAKIHKPLLDCDELLVQYDLPGPVENAQLIFTADDCKKWENKKWQSVNVRIKEPGIIKATMPDIWLHAFINITDQAGLTVSSRIIHFGAC